MVICLKHGQPNLVETTMVLANRNLHKKKRKLQHFIGQVTGSSSQQTKKIRLLPKKSQCCNNTYLATK